MADQTKSDKLWTHRTTAETQKIYADWADTYEADVTAMAYATPDRIAAALLNVTDDVTAPILDFGCGTGLSGLALRKAGFTTIDGTDISPEMLQHATAKEFAGRPLYRTTALGNPDDTGIKQGSYPIIVATGVISLGAAPPELLTQLLASLDSGGILAFSYNDPTLADPAYTNALDAHIQSDTIKLLFREHGPHLSDQVKGADVILLQRT